RDSQRVPVALRIKLRYRKVDTFASKFATNISTHGMFISSRKPKNRGTQLRFELRLADDSTVIAGRGVVAWVRPYDPKQPKEPHGMGIEFVGLSSGSSELISQMVALRVDRGLGDDGIPFALNEPESLPESAENLADMKADRDGEAMPGAGEPSIPSTGFVNVPLTMEDVISSKIDMRAAMLRARNLVDSSETEAELSELSRVSAAPVAETVDAASHELAKLLGGTAVITRSPRSTAPRSTAPRSTAPRSTAPRSTAPPSDHAGLSDIPDAPEQTAEVSVPEEPIDIPDSQPTPPDIAANSEETDDLEALLCFLNDEHHEEEPYSSAESFVEPTPVPQSDEDAQDSADPLEMFEQTVVGDSVALAHVAAPVEDIETPDFPLLEIVSPAGRAEVHMQDIDLYDELVSELEFAATPSEVALNTESQDSNPLDNLPGEIESESRSEQDVLEDLEEQQKRDESADFDVLEELETIEAQKVSEGPAPAGLDAALASLGDSNSDIEDYVDFEIDVTKTV
ncbi:MAG: TIGR02266 family protein, partial [Myxococcales bacterium]|nr:TIGR02266 family protein [Myxococcales bacterium]